MAPASPRAPAPPDAAPPAPPAPLAPAASLAVPLPALTAEAAAAAAGAQQLGRVVAALLALYVIWGSTYFAIRVALQGFPPFTMGAGRFLLAGGLLYLLQRARGEAPPTRQQWLRAGAVGVLLITLGNGCVVLAQQRVASSLAAVMVASMPLFAALCAGMWGKWPGKLEWLGLGLGTAGVVLLNLEGELRASPSGAALLVAAPAAWAFGSVWSRQPDPHMPRGLIASAMQMLCGGAAMALLALLRGEGLPAAPGLVPSLAVGYLVVFGSLVAYSAYGFLLRTVRPTLATSYAYVNPVVALALGTGLGGEQVGGAGLLGAGVILAGVALVALGKGRG
jgi:drug/metabolite transporter (DMT)-like permease